MKRKAFVSFLIIFALFLITGCDNSSSNNKKKEKSVENKSYIHFTDGKQYSFSELSKMEEENTYSFKEKYCSYSSSIKADYVVGELSRILEEKQVDYGSQYLNFLVIELTGGNGFSIDIEIEKERNANVISNMKIGDYLKITNIGSLNCDCYANKCTHKLYNADAELVK